MYAVWKYQVPQVNQFTLEMPENARVLTLQLQYGAPVLFAAVNTESPLVKRRFGIIATGTSVEFKLPKYVGTFQLFGGNTVLHLFEFPSQPEFV